MALWAEGKRVMFIGFSGLQYNPTAICTATPTEARTMVQAFYVERGARAIGAAEAPELSFVRGKKWIGWFSWILPLSEKWPFQTISVSFVTHTEGILVSVEYNVWLFLTTILSPNLLEKEAQELRSVLAR
ncbi:MAG: hypothetical protein P4L91_18480 [Burkholderiaceae bacterium]|nr:hypothetical protein [Burkholderiaceae bacterium]